MKKISIYIGLIVLGLLLGYVLFANKEQHEQVNDHSSETSGQMWTCSMHPQIVVSEQGDCPICGMDLIPTNNSADGLTVDQFSMTENAMALANIQTTVVGGLDLKSEGLKLSGKIKENGDATATQSAHFNGRIEKLYVTSVGEQVKMGQPIAQIYSPELVAAQQELITTSAIKASQPALYNAVRNKFKNWKISAIQLNEIEKTREIQTSFTVYSHVSGIITEILVNDGAHIMDGHPIFKVTNLHTVWASFDAYENQISKLKKGQKVTIKTNAYRNKEFDAVISFIDPVLNTATRTVAVRAILDNKNAVFKPGMFIEGMVSGTTTTIESSILVPKSAILWTGKRSVVYVKTRENQAVFEMREVTLGNAEGDGYQILEGLRNGEEIVTNGTFTVDAAAQLQGKKSMMNKKGRTEQKETNDSGHIATKMRLPKALQDEFMTVLQSYFPIKDALIAGNAQEVAAFSKKMKEEMASMEILNLGKMEQTHVGKSLEMLGAIANEKDIEKQRTHFIILNENLVVLSKSVDEVSNTIYIQKCPMANNNKGASWFSIDNEIRNPYYGEKMMRCGSIVDTLQTK